MIIKKALHSIVILFLLSLLAIPSMAHNLWIETSPTGKVGQTQKVYVYLGEYAYGVRENVSEHLEMLGGDVAVWLIKPNGDKVALDTEIGENRFVAEFTPQNEGHYQLVLNVTNAPVVDWREYNLGTLKTNFFGTATVQVCSPATANLPSQSVASVNKLVIQPTNATDFERNSPLQFQLTYNGKPLAEQEVVIGYKGKWFKTLYTNGEGQLSLT